MNWLCDLMLKRIVAFVGIVTVVGCSNDAQNQKLNSTDEQGARISQLENEVNALKEAQANETASRTVERDQLHTLIIDVDNEVHANRNLEELEMKQAAKH